MLKRMLVSVDPKVRELLQKMKACIKVMNDQIEIDHKNLNNLRQNLLGDCSEDDPKIDLDLFVRAASKHLQIRDFEMSKVY